MIFEHRAGLVLALVSRLQWIVHEWCDCRCQQTQGIRYQIVGSCTAAKHDISAASSRS